jgi:hypothetical protein
VILKNWFSFNIAKTYLKVRAIPPVVEMFIGLLYPDDDLFASFNHIFYWDRLRSCGFCIGVSAFSDSNLYSQAVNASLEED